MKISRLAPRKLIVLILAIIVLVSAAALVVAKRNEGIAQKQKDLYSRSVKAYAEGKFDPAITQLEDAVEINPDDAKAQQLLGKAYEAKGKLDKAVTAYKASLKADGKQPEVLYNVAVIYKSQGKIEDAVELLEEAKTINKDFVAARIMLGDLYAQQGEKDKAKGEYEAVVEMKPFGIDIKSIQSRIENLE